MKLKTLAIAVAMASVPFAAQADFTVSGDVGVGFFKNDKGETSFGGAGSEVKFHAEETVGGITYFGHFETNVADKTINSVTRGEGGVEPSVTTSAGSISTDDMYIGAKGAFGEVRLGETDNGCDVVDVGFVNNDYYLGHGSGGCKGKDEHNITYQKTAGAVTYAASFSPDVDKGSAQVGSNGLPTDSFALGVKGKMGPATVSLGYESEVSNGPNDGNNFVLGVAASFGSLDLGIRANQFENGPDKTHVGYSAKYTAGNNEFSAGFGTTPDDSYMLGYARNIGKQTVFAAEFRDVEDATSNEYGIGFIHKF